jgi:signal transduction histidine kinase
VTQTASRPDELVLLDATLAGLAEHLDEPSAASRARVRDRLAAYAEAIGVDGLALRIEGAGLEGVSAGVGSLRRAAGTAASAAADGEGGVEADPGGAPRPGVHPVLPSAEGGRIGEVVSDPSHAGAAALARGVELLVDARLARASARMAVARLRAVDEAARAVAGVLSVDRVLQVIVDRVRELVDARYAALGIVDATGRIDRFITSGIARAARDAIGEPPRGRGILGHIIRGGQALRIADMDTDPRRAGFPPNHPPMRSFLGVPVTVKGRLIGDLYLTDKRGREEFTDEDQKLVETFALHAGIAIDNARLHEQVQRLAIVEERERIGRDLHDGIIQSIYAVGLSLEDVPELMDEDPADAKARVDRAIEALDKTIRDIRNFIFGLRPELLQGMALAAGLSALVEEFRVNTMGDAEVRADDVDLGEITADETGQLLIIAREALSNVARHARASRATVDLRSTPERIVLAIEDNGTGFAVEAARAPTHQGLANMRNRAHALGATIVIDSAPGAGTRIIVTLPRRDGATSGGEM